MDTPQSRFYVAGLVRNHYARTGEGMPRSQLRRQLGLAKGRRLTMVRRAIDDGLIYASKNRLFPVGRR